MNATESQTSAGKMPAMSEFPYLDDFLFKQCADKFKDKTRFLGLFGSVVYTVTGEKLEGGFRYFACEPEPLLDAFSRRDLAAMLELPFAVDDDGDPDTSSLYISLNYTKSGSVLAMQVRQYQNSNPVPISPPVLVEGPEAGPLVAKAKELDQSN